MDNSVQLLGVYGGDLEHSASAWTSTSRHLNEDKLARIPSLIRMLAKAGHHSPFEKSSLHFLVTCEDASHIHLLKHRIGVSINSESARYKELKDDKYYVPQDWPPVLKVYLDEICKRNIKIYHDLIEMLVNGGMDRKRAKESARFILPKANQLTLDVMFNWRSFAHFCGLRRKKEAQLEIHNIANEMLRLVKEIPENPFRFTIEAFEEAGLLGYE